MKKALFLSVLLLALVATLHAQAPRSINSQAVLRDAAGRLIANQSVGVRIIIAQGSPTGTVAYEETHVATTNENGLYTITIGAGTPATGTFSAIDWGNGPYFITTDIDPAGGSNYTITTSQQFLSVPYALLADTAVRVARATTAANAVHATNADHSTLSDNATNSLYADTALYYRERQVLTRSNDTIYLTGGSYVVLPPSSNANINNNYIDSVIHANNSTVVNRYVDSVVNARNTTVVNNIQNQISDSVRQMQTLLRDSIIIRHSDSSHTAIYSDTARYYQERQMLSRGNDTIYLTGGSYVVLPPSGNAYINNHYIDSVVNARTTTMVNNFQNQLADSSRTLRTVIRDSSLLLMRDSIVSIIRDSATTIQQSISALPAGVCYASCSSVDSLRRRQDSAQRAFDSIVNVQTVVLHRNDSVINVQRLSIRHYDSIIRTFDSVVTVYDSLIVRIKHVCDSVSGGNSGSMVITDGALPGVFSVSPTKKVRFSQGNLQYQASTDTWRFAEHQYDYVGDALYGNVYVNGVKSNNANISSTYDGWIDLFGWGTSGYHDPADIYNTRYMPYEITNPLVNGTYNYYGYGPSTNQTSPSLTGSSAHYDWGVHNAISNGGNVAGRWRTLTSDEWQYLLGTRSTTGVIAYTSNVRYCKATVNGVQGLIIFPDSYVHPTGVPFFSQTNRPDSYYSDTFSSRQWGILESAGCVFLPVTSNRNGTTVSDMDSSPIGYYWSSSYSSYEHALYISFSLGNMRNGFPSVRYIGNSVRLVQDVSE